ncbi:MAG: hypothetical protein NTX87_04865 [Planctomycetota bacterium]|nr:hypothetical protein [Planctomycetota bacterium]
MKPMPWRSVAGWILLSLTVLAIAAAGAAGAAGEEARDVRRPKKLIAVGWDLSFDTKWLREHRDEMEKRPFDGIVINVDGRRDDGKEQPLRLAFSREPWKYEWFAAAGADLVACRFSRLTDNFIMVGANPGDVDWFDDEGWRNIVEHWRIAARLARATGARGLGFDPEPYYQPHAAFTYRAQGGRDRHTFDEYAAKVRERGREVMKAVAAEYPDITVLSFFLSSICAGATGHADPQPLLAGEGYGLLPAFLDGWLDAAPPAVTLVDGHESSYLYNSDIQFLEAANLIRGACQELVSPENRAKYRAQVQAGFGIYLDAYHNPPSSRWYIDGKGGPRVQRLRANTAAAVRAADRYVWIYGEKCRWWPTPNKGVTEMTWPEALPGCEDALRQARDPLSWGQWKVGERAKAGTLKDLAVNGDFSAARPEAAAGAAGDTRPKKIRLPADWSTWQDDKSKGTFACDGDAGAAGKGAAKLSGMADGCFIQKIKARPGQWFALEAMRRIQGRGDAVLIARWQTPDEKWTAEERDVHIISTDPRGQWGRMFGVAQTPESAGSLLILLLARGQPSPEDAAWFDDVRVYALD